MLDRKLVRRTFLAAALTISGAHATTASGFQQGQYQPGQPGQQIPQGNSKVTRELNRMFQENGQQMPSMNVNELPNANVPTQGQVRPRQTANALQLNTNSVNHTQSKQTGGSGKQSILGRFFGKLRGDTGHNNPDYQPPVPPETTDRTAQVYNGATSPIPPGSRAALGAANTGVSVSPTPNAVGQRIEYTQPGSAPGFMSTAGAAKVVQKQPVAVPSSRDKFQEEFSRNNTGEVAGTGQKARATTQDVSSRSAAADSFEVPFSDSAESLEETQTLDLDSLIEIPAATPQPAESASEYAGSTADENAGEEMVPDATDIESAKAPEENPFTGVQLNTSDAEFFGSQGQTNGVGAGSSGDSASPMEDFDFNLPSVDLPPIDEDAVGAGDELISTPAAESISPTEVATPSKSSNFANAAARAELKRNVDDSEPMSADIPDALSAAETARLRQTTEQARRQLQHRQIQARTGQTGFKGFCPVALRERRELVDSSEKFTSTFGLQSYAFSSAESKAAFDTDPSRYAPAAGGSDVVVLVNSGEEQAGQLDYALWYRDRLYLFRSSETMTLFSKDPQRFASQY